MMREEEARGVVVAPHPTNDVMADGGERGRARFHNHTSCVDDAVEGSTPVVEGREEGETRAFWSGLANPPGRVCRLLLPPLSRRLDEERGKFQEEEVEVEVEDGRRKGMDASGNGGGGGGRRDACVGGSDPDA